VHNTLQACVTALNAPEVDIRLYCPYHNGDAKHAKPENDKFENANNAPSNFVLKRE
jgi:hypothetical protein